MIIVIITTYEITKEKGRQDLNYVYIYSIKSNKSIFNNNAGDFNIEVRCNNDINTEDIFKNRLSFDIEKIEPTGNTNEIRFAIYNEVSLIKIEEVADQIITEIKKLIKKEETIELLKDTYKVH